MSYTGPINPIIGGYPVSLYGYVPNSGAGIFAAIVWGFLLIPHVIWMIARKGRMIQGLIIFGCLWEIIGYSIRASSAYNPFNYGLFIAQYVILQVTPIFFVMALVYAIGWGMDGKDNASWYQRFRPRFLIPALQIFNFVALIHMTIGSTMYAIGLARQVARKPVGYNTAAARNVLIAGQAFTLASLVAILAILTDLLIHFKQDTARRTPHSTAIESTNSNSNTNAGHTPAATDVNTAPLANVASHGTATTAVDANFIPTSPPASGPKEVGRAITTLFLGIAWLTAGMLVTRTSFRLAETALDVFAVSWSSQALFGTFEFAVVWVTVLIWACCPFAEQMVPEVVHAPAPTMSNKSRV